MSDTLRKIPLSNLTAAANNVRKTDRGAEVAALAASIEAHGLLQNLTVRQVESANGKSESYEVIAGGRRLQALKLLAKRRSIAKDFAVPCKVLKSGDAGNVELSLAENVVRTALHPADQFDAFSVLHAEGLCAADIAARFGVSTIVVEQRLKLAAVSPKLMAIYKKGGMTLDQLSAFTISDDHELQEHVWFEAPLFDRSAQALRRALTKSLVLGGDRRARYIGVKAYESAGGVVVRDLFDPNASYFSDSQLLDRLAIQKLQNEADQVKQEQWNWVEIRVEPNYEELSHFGRVTPKEAKPSKREARRLKTLGSRYDLLVSELDEKPSDEASAEIDRIEVEIAVSAEKRMLWTKKDKARAGAIVSLDPQGLVRVIRGLIRSEDRPIAKKEVAELEHINGTGNGLSEALVRDLSAHLTSGLREALAEQPQIALSALLYTLILRTFFDVDETCVEIDSHCINLATHADGIEEYASALAMSDRHQKWAERLPEQEKILSWIVRQTLEDRLELLAYLVGRSVNGVHSVSSGDGERWAQATALAKITSLDMSKWWTATRASYFGRVSKQHIVEAITEAVSASAGEDIAHLKKPVMAARAEDLVKKTNWLPQILRTVSSGQTSEKRTLRSNGK